MVKADFADSTEQMLKSKKQQNAKVPPRPVMGVALLFT
jgi:hypothetical protein